MKDLKKEDIKQEVFDLYDDYAHNKLNRRQFVEKLGSLCCWWFNSVIVIKFCIP